MQTKPDRRYLSFFGALLLAVAAVLFASSGSLVAQNENAQHENAPSHETAGQQEPGGHGHPVLEEFEKLHTLEMESKVFFTKTFSHSVPYVIFEPKVSPSDDVNHLFRIYNVQPWQWISLGLMLAIFLPVVWSFGRPTGKATRIMRGWCLWVRDEMVYRVMGKEEGRAFVPFFLFLFFFLVFQNVIGLIPSVGHHFPLSIYTATGTPYVTGAFALITFAMMLFFGMKKNGAFGYWKGLIPHGLPVILLPMMVVIELVGLLVKPFALMVRLFANMLAGHLVVGAALSLIFLFTKLQGGAITSYLTALPCAGMAIFIYTIEAFVTLLQAYIFTFLSITFIHQAMHQEH
ncbi:MAG: F0F1 ATP synthase subunit A [Planctomycetes bacterium]|nr:F0F1 ATP synthase subunit A [Planctomycetota bacterium]MCB9885228.1 F0F1 ATP synthase subunit A [Planctomycetota bacterium]